MDFGPAYRILALDLGPARCKKQGVTGGSRSQLLAFTTEGSLKPQKALSGHRRAPMNVLVPLAEPQDVQAWQVVNVNGTARPFFFFFFKLQQRVR